MNQQQRTIKEALEHELKIRAARENFADYVRFTNPDFIDSKFHTYLMNRVQEFLDTTSSNSFDILLVSIPPQHGKSKTITQTLPAYYVGQHPERDIIIASYNEDTATMFGRRNKDKIEAYHGEVFPECVLKDSPNSATNFETTKDGRVISRGVMSGITGNPAHLFIIDDPIKNRQEADSPRIRESLWNEYLNTFKTRIKPNGKLIVIQTRWHEDDLFGKLAKHERNVQILNIPCECVDEATDPLGRKLGEPLCPEIGRGKAWMESFKHVYIHESNEGGLRAWTALYQGMPTSKEGNILQREWWQYYDHLDLDTVPYTIMSVDAAFKDGENNDYVAIGVWGKINKRYYLIDNIKEHLSFTETLQAIRTLKQKYPQIMFILVEDKANGSAIINVISSEFDGVIPIEPQGGKVARVNAISPVIEQGRVYLPKYAMFTKDFVDECAQFPNGSNDDQVDQMSQALNRMIFVDADVIAPDKIVYTVWTDDMIEDYDRASEELQIHLTQIWGFNKDF